MHALAAPQPAVRGAVWVFICQREGERAWRIISVGMPGDPKGVVRQQGEQRLPEGWSGQIHVISKTQVERQLPYEWERYEATRRQIDYFLEGPLAEQVAALKRHAARARLCYPCTLFKHQLCEGPILCACATCRPIQ